jgi:hypothetical protein
MLGFKAKDKITGFNGIVVGKCEYLTGCTQFGVQPEVTETGAFVDLRWFDEGRLIFDKQIFEKEDVKSLENGSDFPPPNK